MELSELNRSQRRMRQAISTLKSEIDPDKIASVITSRVLADVLPRLEQIVDSAKSDPAVDRTDEIIQALSGIRIEPTDLKPIEKQIRALEKIVKEAKPKPVKKWTLSHERNSRGKIVKTEAVATY